MVIKGFSQDLGFKGQLSAWLVAKPFDDFQSQLGARYIPELSYGYGFKEKYTLDAEVSLNIYGYGYYNGDSIEWDGDFDLFRGWVRFSTNRLNVRAGLQKINFGSAAMLRPLMWFDQIDPRDPLQLTEGVYSILGRYYFPNNANIWLWFLYGNDKQKGWEVFPSFKDIPEFGGRFQIPLLTGELGVSYHHRVANTEGTIPPEYQSSNFKVPENRIGLDGKWDVGVGIWFETAFIRQEIDIPELKTKKLINMGLDYTIGIGNGLLLIGEQLWFTTGEEFFNSIEQNSFTAISANYPISIIDNLTYIFYYDWSNNGIYNFINWGMTWDKINLYIMAYWNPDNFTLYQNLSGEATLYTGKGFQVQFVFNH
jgi:hypothetical protein